MTVENVKKAIALLEAINPKNEYAYEKAVLAYLTIGRLPVLQYEIPAKSVFFRTRTHEDDDLFPLISDISITPNQFVKDFARCNRPFQSKFYCSENRPTSFAELVEYWSDTKDFGDKVYVTIGRWELKKPLIGIIVTTPDKEHRISEFDKEHGAAMETFIEQSDPEIDYILGNNLELTHILRNELTVSKNENGKHGFTETGKVEASGFDIENNLISW